MGNNISLADNQEVSYESGASRLCKSVIMAVCVAPLIILGTCFLLGWNERRAVCNDRAILAGEDVVKLTSAQCANPLEENGELIMFSCDIDKASVGTIQFGGDFSSQTPIVATGLTTQAQMYQCIEHESSRTEKKPGGGTETVTTYTYTKEWRDSFVDSQAFNSKGLSSQNWRENCNYYNPPWPPGLPQSGTRYATQMKVGPFNSAAVISSVPRNTPVSVTGSLPAGWYGSSSSYSSNKWEVGNGIGQVQVSFKINDWANPMATVLGKNNGGTITDWTAPSSWLCSGFTLLELEMGKKSKSELFDNLRSQNSAITWVLRIVGLILLWVAFCMCFGPLEVAADCIPCIGPCIGNGIEAIACCIACLPATACCLGVAGVVWVVMRPIVGIPLMIFWVVVMVGFGVFIAKSRAKKGRRTEVSLQSQPLAYAAGGTAPQPAAAQLYQPAVAVVPAQPVSQPRQQMVAVPQGCGPGSLIQVQTPSGLMQVTVPDGCYQGTQFAITY